ncbi:type IV pilus modification protein PilV [Acinetobacter sp.]|jgi:type IV pilus assembly protein PilV|uniref:type IV pilus modification protein PilV n=1 Tax=Acinetobacter sp. TaxID=472 RepID=UPI002839FEBC|nr:type IV pilus modification protein PilV [Acinetobacter sp.]MDR0237945.1 type IV pilus modification protein PilV [Acinetobacter sp.]
MMKTISAQKGIGMMEVIVALILLSIGVLGFAMLQMRAMEASLDASKRIQAMSLARDLSERMRANNQGLSKNITIKVNDADQVIDAYANAFAGRTYATSYSPKCSNTIKCSSQKFAEEDVNQILYKAFLNGMKAAISDCPGNMSRSRYCVYVAWDETDPSNGGSTNSCTKDGSYNKDSKCVILEAY